MLERQPAKSRLGVITASWPDPDNYRLYPEIWGQLPPKRVYEEIVLTGDDFEDELRLRSSRLKIQKILSNKDSLAGIHFRFTNDSKYWTFIKALDLCRLEYARNYIPHNNNLWLFYQPRRIDSSNHIKPIYL